MTRQALAALPSLSSLSSFVIPAKAGIQDNKRLFVESLEAQLRNPSLAFRPAILGPGY